MPEMHPASYRLLADLEAAFDALLAQLEQVVTTFERSGCPAWAFAEPVADAAWLRRALMDMWHEEGQDGRETRNYIGLIAADTPLIEEVVKANQAKARISHLLQQIKQTTPHALSEAKALLPQRHPHVNALLRRGGLAKLHLKQCWRQLPVAQAPVARVRLAWYSSGRSIKRLSVQEAEAKLLQLDTQAPHVQIQLRKLAGIPSQEILAQVQAQAPLMRANLFYVEPLEDGHTRRALNVALPLFLPAPEQRLPDYNTPPAHPPTQRTRARRRDEKLEDDAFLPSLRAYRYRQASI
ncbi:DNA replication terminus site-binding protein [Vreelandella rituensis]|uniref:DNA replication terminus site-binding protein n=1 Tax=Vreelandella rituensis TaxID=2282306 RepID=A0A368UBC4_9GAMM|nr:DNA replication terminus site-binding protein [Halomonas rituensis]RCV92583.1 DNA replication terminus site-binding protein [Halomonas rituensis]